MNKRTTERIIAIRDKAWKNRNANAKLIGKDGEIIPIPGRTSNPEMYSKTQAEHDATKAAKSAYKASMRTYGGKATRSKIQKEVATMNNRIGAKLNFS